MDVSDSGLTGAAHRGERAVGPGPGEAVYDLTEVIEEGGIFAADSASAADAAGAARAVAAEDPSAATGDAGGRRIIDLTDVIEEGPVFPPEAEACREEMIRRAETAAEAIARQILPAVAERIAREGFPEIAARIVREEIEKLKSETEDEP